MLPLAATAIGLSARPSASQAGSTPAHLAGLRWIDASNERLTLAPLSPSSSMDAEAADLDSDGDLDLVIAVELGRNYLLENDGRGHFKAALPLAFARQARDSEDIAIADFDGDTHLDIVFVSEDDQVNEHYRGDGAGGFEPAAALPVDGTSNAVLALDVDGDTDIDLLLGNAGQNALLLNDGLGRFTDGTAGRLPERRDQTQDIEAGDVNGDGQIDLVLANEGPNHLLLGQGGGRYVDAPPDLLPAGIGEETREADLGDVDGDGDLDLVFANVVFQAGSDARNRLLLNDGAGRFRELEGALPAERHNTVDIDLVDLDHDGDLDMLQAQAFGGGPRYMENDGTGRFTDVTREVSTPSDWNGVDVEAFDADGDGWLEIFWANYNSADRLMAALPPPAGLLLPWLGRGSAGLEARSTARMR